MMGGTTSDPVVMLRINIHVKRALNTIVRMWRTQLHSIVGICMISILTVGIVCLVLSSLDPGLVLRKHEIETSKSLSSEITSFGSKKTFVGRSSLALLSIEDTPNYEHVINKTINFDINGHDVMVFLHIQKTGGTTFGRHLVDDLQLERPCVGRKRRRRVWNCFRPNRNEHWLFSRFTTSWPCGVHADWTELTNCVHSRMNIMESADVQRRYFYVTLLREPVARYLSEFRHVRIGATWTRNGHWCGGRRTDLPKCYSTQNWTGVTLEQFMACPHNLANNRQTRMLADLSLVGCYNSTVSRTERDMLMLASAKRNLESMPYFMLIEYQAMGQYMFEETFNMRFLNNFVQKEGKSAPLMKVMSEEQIEAIKRLNRLDIELYEYGKRIAFERFNRLRYSDQNFTQRFPDLGQLLE